MAKRSGKNDKNKSGRKAALQPVRAGGLQAILDDFRQVQHPIEFRIVLPSSPILPPQPATAPTKKSPKIQEPVRERSQQETSLIALAEVATCLWCLKTKHFKREWLNEDTTDDDPRTRRTLGRLNKGADALKKCGLEVADPTGKRYPTGGEAMMRPLDFVPTQGLTYEKVTEAVMPLVYWHGRLIQRAEVFVAVPPTADVKGDTPVPMERNNANTGGEAEDQSAEGRRTPSGDGQRTTSNEQPAPKAECPTVEGPVAPSEVSPVTLCSCDSTQQKTGLAANTTNNTASAGTGEQA